MKKKTPTIEVRFKQFNNDDFLLEYKKRILFWYKWTPLSDDEEAFAKTKTILLNRLKSHLNVLNLLIKESETIKIYNI